jgi:hypothetical protein
MKQSQFMTRMEELHMDAVEISRRKNADYANDDDPFQNFRSVEALGLNSNEGIIIRMMDKMSRAANLLKREAKVTDESIYDTLSDLSNYALILRIKLEDEQQKNSLPDSSGGPGV